MTLCFHVYLYKAVRPLCIFIEWGIAHLNAFTAQKSCKGVGRRQIIVSSYYLLLYIRKKNRKSLIKRKNKFGPDYMEVGAPR